MIHVPILWKQVGVATSPCVGDGGDVYRESESFTASYAALEVLSFCPSHLDKFSVSLFKLENITDPL